MTNDAEKAKVGNLAHIRSVDFTELMLDLQRCAMSSVTRQQWRRRRKVVRVRQLPRTEVDMALLECDVRGAQISDKAVTCIKFGALLHSSMARPAPAGKVVTTLQTGKKYRRRSA